MRAFIAIALPPEIKRYLAKVQEKLAAGNADVKWVEPDNIHLTLKFLGEIDEPAREKIRSTISDIARSVAPFSVRLASCGAFPRIESARVIWMGVGQGERELQSIAGLIEERMSQLGIAREDRPFSSHITLGRTRSGKNLKGLAALLKDLCERQPDKIYEFQADRITLFKSTLTPRGPRYEIIHEACFTL
ncbi:MAG: RNA 2',3'-cyclic phosphodiesterase [Candidatus Omnitrophica bacterium]|nr:RNA 2',3'-cyclic phosphodiesterase [Candidatus Omnitrophota bacterium]